MNHEVRDTLWYTTDAKLYWLVGLVMQSLWNTSKESKDISFPKSCKIQLVYIPDFLQ